MAFYNTKQTKYTPAPVPSQPGYQPPTPPTPPTPGGGSVPVIPIPSFTGDSEVIFYNTYSDNNMVNKELFNQKSFNVSFKMDTSILKPVLLLESEEALTNYNYMYIDIVHRYYFIDNIEVLPGGLFRIYAHCDVLMSFADGIKAMNGIVVKAEDAAAVNLDLNDGSFINQEGIFIENKIYSNGFMETPIYILMAGGKETHE